MLGHVLTHLNYAVKRWRKRKPPLAAVPDVAGRRFLFIGGLHRSGTSIVHRLLRAHPDASGFADTGVFEDEGQHLQRVFPPAGHYGGPGRFAFDLRTHLTERSELVSVENRERLLRDWGAYYDLKKTLLLEKSPPNMVRGRFLQAMFPGSVFVFVVRHPIAVALATRKWLDVPVPELLFHWHAAYALMLSDLPFLSEFRVIRYEDLVADTVGQLASLQDLAGVARVAPAERVSDHNASYFESWSQAFADDIEAVEALFPSEGTVMERFGYSFSEPYVGAPALPMPMGVPDWRAASGSG